MTPRKFDSLVAAAGLRAKSVAACRRVLVDGIEIVEYRLRRIADQLAKWRKNL